MRPLDKIKINHLNSDWLTWKSVMSFEKFEKNDNQIYEKVILNQ